MFYLLENDVLFKVKRRFSEEKQSLKERIAFFDVLGNGIDEEIYMNFLLFGGFMLSSQYK